MISWRSSQKQIKKKKKQQQPKNKKPRRLILLAPPPSNYELHGSDRQFNLPPIVSAVLPVLPPLEQWGSRERGSWLCLGGASRLYKLRLPSGRQLCRWAALWSRDPQLCSPPVATNRHAIWCCFFRYCLIWLVVFLLQEASLSWHEAESGKDSVWLLLEPEATGQDLPHSFGFTHQPNESC